MAFSKIILNGVTLMDATIATAAAEDITSPKTAMLADGVVTEGTGSGGGGGSAEDYAKGLVPAGDIVLSGNYPLVSRGIVGRTALTSITLSEATSMVNNGNYCITNNSGSFTIYAPYLTGIPNYGISDNSGLTAACFPSLNGGMTANNLRANGNATIIDIGSTSSLSTTCMYGCSRLVTLISRKSDALISLGNINALQNTPFYTNGTGGTMYIPNALYIHLGDGTSLDYQSATNWVTLYTAGTITFAKLETSAYESTSWILN